MTDLLKKTLAKFEHTHETMPRLSVEPPAAGAEQAAPELGKTEVRSMRVPKLDEQTVWRVIETLKSL